MNKAILNSKTFEEWQNSMDTTADGGSIDYKEIETKSDNPCYIGVNGEDLTDVVSYQDLVKEAEEWLQTDTGILEMKLRGWNPTADELVKDFFQSEPWVFFGTWLDEPVEL